MHKVLGIISLLFSSFLIGQNTFELQVDMPGYQAPGDLIVTDQESYIISGISYNDTTNAYDGILHEVSASGAIIKTNTYSVSDSTCFFSEIIKLDSNFLVFGGIGPKHSGFTSILICSYDYNLEYKWSKCYQLSNFHEVGQFKAKIDFDSSIIILGSVLKQVKYYDYDPFMFRCNQEGDSILMVVETLDYNQFSFDFLIRPDTSGYIAFGRAQYPNYPYFESCGAFYIHSFTLDSVIAIPDEMFNSSHTVNWINEREFLISGKKNISVNYTLIQGAGLKRMDTSFSIIHEVDFAHIMDTASYPGWERNYDYLDLNNIHFVWNKNYDDLFQTMPSWIVLTKFDSVLNIVYDRYFGGDAMYSAYRVNSTEDGGCIIFGIVYKYQGYDYDLYLIKTDENGLVTSVDEDYLQCKLSLQVFPNPCTERISFDHDLTLVDIFDHSGQLVLRYQNYNKHSDIAIGLLQSGVYIYRALSKEGGFASGKFVKR